MKCSNHPTSIGSFQWNVVTYGRFSFKNTSVFLGRRNNLKNLLNLIRLQRVYNHWVLHASCSQQAKLVKLSYGLLLPTWGQRQTKHCCFSFNLTKFVLDSNRIWTKWECLVLQCKSAHRFSFLMQTVDRFFCGFLFLLLFFYT